MASAFTMTSTHRTDGGGAETIAIEGMDLLHIASGRIQRIDAYYDRLGPLVEMGVLQPPAGA